MKLGPHHQTSHQSRLKAFIQLSKGVSWVSSRCRWRKRLEQRVRLWYLWAMTGIRSGSKAFLGAIMMHSGRCTHRGFLHSCWPFHLGTSITLITVRIIATNKNGCSQSPRFPINDSALYRVSELDCLPSTLGSLNAVGSHSMAYEPRKHTWWEGACTGDACWPRCFLDPEVCQYQFQKAHNIPWYGNLGFFLFTLLLLTIFM